jgi:hypothetical protein
LQCFDIRTRLARFGATAEAACLEARVRPARAG